MKDFVKVDRVMDPHNWKSSLLDLSSDRRTLIWRVGEGKDDVVALGADALWQMKHGLAKT